MAKPMDEPGCVVCDVAVTMHATPPKINLGFGWDCLCVHVVHVTHVITNRHNIMKVYLENAPRHDKTLLNNYSSLLTLLELVLPETVPHWPRPLTAQIHLRKAKTH